MCKWFEGWQSVSMLLEQESMLGVMGGARVYAAGARVYASLVILVSALGPNFGLGLGLGPGLDNLGNVRGQTRPQCSVGMKVVTHVPRASTVFPATWSVT